MGKMGSPNLRRIIEHKHARRQQLARAPIEEKIRALIKLQELSAPILRRRGRNVRPWRIATSDASSSPCTMTFDRLRSFRTESALSRQMLVATQSFNRSCPSQIKN
jgi:hypothetical protein